VERRAAVAELRLPVEDLAEAREVSRPRHHDPPSLRAAPIPRLRQAIVDAGGRHSEAELRVVVQRPRVLIVGYQVPPIGGVGVRRAVKFSRYLDAAGYDVVVLTGPGVEGAWTPHDTSLVDEVAAIPTVRIDGPTPQRRGGRQRRVDRLLGRPDAVATWWS